MATGGRAIRRMHAGTGSGGLIFGLFSVTPGVWNGSDITW